MAGIYAEQFAHLFDFRSLRAQTGIPPNPVLFSPYPVLLNGPLVKNAMCTSLLFFFSCSSKQILHQVCKMCSSLTFLGPVLKVKALKSTGNLFPYSFKNPHGQKSFDQQLKAQQWPCSRNWWVRTHIQIQHQLRLTPLLVFSPLAKASGKTTSTKNHRAPSLCPRES